MRKKVTGHQSLVFSNKTLGTSDWGQVTKIGAEAVHGQLGNRRTTALFVRRVMVRSTMGGYKTAACAQTGAQLVCSNLGPKTQLFGKFNRAMVNLVHTMHRPYGNYYYVYK